MVTSNKLVLKTILVGAAILGTFFALGGPCPAMALEGVAGPGLASRSAIVQDKTVDNLKKRADQEIERRIASLNKWLTKLSGAKHLTADDKANLTALVQSDITNLTALKVKIGADTDITTLRADVKSIVSDYRVYLLIHPKLGLIVAGDNVLTYADKLTEIETKLQDKVTEAQGMGQDVTKLQSELTDMQAKIADAKLQAQKIHDTIIPLTPDGYPGNKSTLQAAVALLKTAHTDLQMARTDARMIMQGLNAIRQATKTATPSATTTTP